jgi:hypothetical protein
MAQARAFPIAHRKMRSSFFPPAEIIQTMAKTWAHTATMARNKLIDARAKASSATARTMDFS